jgi:hypothetical protein
MTRKKHLARVRLRDAANALSEEIWEHKWDHLPEVKSTPIGLWTEIPRELEKRCPGHSLEEYQEAIARSMLTRR